MISYIARTVLTADDGADDLSPPDLLGLDNRTVEVLVASRDVLVHLLHRLLDLRDRLVLLLDEHCHLLEHLGKLGHRLLDLLQLDVAVLHLALGAARASHARAEESLGEDLGVVAVHGFLDLGGGGVGLDDAVLACDAVLRLGAVLLLDGLVLLQEAAELIPGGGGLPGLRGVALGSLEELPHGGGALLTELARLLGDGVGGLQGSGVCGVLSMSGVQRRVGDPTPSS